MRFVRRFWLFETSNTSNGFARNHATKGINEYEEQQFPPSGWELHLIRRGCICCFVSANQVSSKTSNGETEGGCLPRRSVL